MRVGRQLPALVTAVALLAALSGCAAEIAPSALSPAENPAVAVPGALAASLFPADQAVMSNDDIAKVFALKVTTPHDAKVAVVRYGGPRLWYWSEDFARQDQQALDEFLSKLRAAKGLKSVSVVPQMLMPHQATIPYLREMAARLQADLVLVYRPASESYQKYKFLQREKTRSYCTVEAALVDTRSGIVIFTTRATKNYAAERTSRDMSFEETVAQAEQQAIGQAMSRVADDVAAFLNGQPAGGGPKAE